MEHAFGRRIAPLAQDANRVEHEPGIERRSREHPGLFIGGNGLRGLGMDSLVRDAELQSDAVVRHLESSHRTLPGASEQLAGAPVEVRRSRRAV